MQFSVSSFGRFYENQNLRDTVLQMYALNNISHYSVFFYNHSWLKQRYASSQYKYAVTMRVCHHGLFQKPKQTAEWEEYIVIIAGFFLLQHLTNCKKIYTVSFSKD
jgi:hypothetical protein